MAPVPERTFGMWLALSRDHEVLAPLDLVRAALGAPGLSCRGRGQARVVVAVVAAEGRGDPAALSVIIAPSSP